MRRPPKKGISTIAGTILFVVLIFVLQTSLFLMVYRYNGSMQEAVKTETERMQERIVLTSLKTDNSTGIENISALLVNNTGAIAVRIRAMYIDNQFWCDPSDATINPNDTFINAKETLWVLLPTGRQYNPNSTITAATERGTKSTEIEHRLRGGGGGPPPSESNKFYLGPLMLDFTRFYYAAVYSNGSLKSSWKPGWSVDANIAVAWNVTVKNIDNRNITINQFSAFTLWTNDGQNNRRPWYFAPPKDSLTQRIAPNQTVQIVYKWATPATNQTKLPNTQSTLNVATSSGSLPCRTFLTFFGIFHELDGTTKPYGQTIPFEALLIEKVAFQVSAQPTVFILNYTNASIIRANITRGGKPLAGATVNFITTAGTLSSSSAITNANGIATVYLTMQGVSSPVDATVTATWSFYTASTSVYFVFEAIQITASPNVLLVNSTNTSTITATVTARGTPVRGANITFTTNAGTLSSAWGLTDALGVATSYLYPSVDPAVATVTAKWINTLVSVTVRFENATVIMFASPALIATNSSMSSAITALVKLGSNVYAGANVTFTTTAGSLSRQWAITNASGMAATYLAASMSPAIASVTATWMSASNSTIVRFTNLYVTTDRQQYLQNDTVKISGFLRYENGTSVQGIVVSLNITASNGTVIRSANSTQTDLNGAFTYDLQLVNAAPDTYTIVATYQTYQENYRKFTVT